MRLAVISDIHGNLEAFEAVLRDMKRTQPDDILCLGDNVGYGPDPEAVLNELRDRRIPSVMGNHELGIVNARALSWFNDLARQSLEITRQLLSAESVEFIANLPPLIVMHGVRAVHGFPPASMTRYLLEAYEAEIARVMEHLDEDICFVGHTHELRLVSISGKRVEYQPLKRGSVSLPEGKRYIINAGSVGQPRDGDNRAKYVIWDTEARILEVRRIPYNIPLTAEKIRQRGLPEFNAHRLF